MLDRRQLHALRLIGDQLLGGPAGGRDAPLEVGQLLVWHVDFERAGGEVGRGGHAAAFLLLDSPPLSAWQARKDGRTGRADAHSASATLTSFTTTSRPGNTLTGHWSVPSAGRARHERRSRQRAHMDLLDPGLVGVRSQLWCNEEEAPGVVSGCTELSDHHADRDRAR